MCLKYSPLCDTDKSVYLRYLEAAAESFRYGQSPRLPVVGGDFSGFATELGRGNSWCLGDCEGASGVLGRGGQRRLGGGGDGVVVDSVAGCCGGGTRCWVCTAGLVAKEAEKGVGCADGVDDAASHERGLCGDVGSGSDAEVGVKFAGKSGVSATESDRASVPGAFGVRGRAPVAGTLGASGVQAGVSGSDVSEKTLANRLRRQEKKALKKKRQVMGQDWRVKGGARAFPREVDESWVARKKAENVLKEAQAKRQLVLLEAQDIEVLKRRQLARARKQMESDMVAIERAHATLAATDNVPKDGSGFCETVVSGGSVPTLLPGSGSISPDSSASQHEFRMAQKEILDLRKEKEDLEKEFEMYKRCTDLHEGKEVVFTDCSRENSLFVSASVNEKLCERFGRKNLVSVLDKEIMGGACVKVEDSGDCEDYYDGDPERLGRHGLYGSSF